jgi:hypothetical protein
MNNHKWDDKDIEEAKIGYGADRNPITLELDFVEGTRSILLSRDDIIAMAKYFNIVKLI